MAPERLRVTVTRVPRSPSRFLPGLRVAREYQRAWALPDLVAGVVLVALLVPQGMAYAGLAGMPPVTGLYATVIALLAYALVGPSRTLILGPDSALSPLVFAAVTPLVAVGASANDRVVFASMLALLMGALCVAAGLFRLGIIGELLSSPMRVGFMNGIAVVVLVSQLPELFGFSTDADGVVDEVRAFVEGVADGRTNTTALAIGATSLLVIVGAYVLDRRIPGVLIAVVGATLAVALFDLEARGIAVVGQVPQGFPRPEWPGVSLADTWKLFVGAIGLAFVTIADTVALSRSFAGRGEDVDGDQELVAVGAANAAAGLFQGFPLCASSSRTAVAQSTGAKSQLTGIVGAAGILVLLVALPGITDDLPEAALAAIVVAASLAIFELRPFFRLLRVRRSEFLLAAATFAGVVFVGVLQGIAIAAALSLANFVRRAWRPYTAVLGRIDRRKGYHDVGRHPEARQIPGLVILRFDAPLFFANVGYFVDRIDALVADRDEPVRRVIVAAPAISDIDTTAADALDQLVDRLRARSVDLVFAQLKGPVKDRLDRYGLARKLGDHGFPPTMGTAIDDYVEASGVDWVDWEEREEVQQDRDGGRSSPDA